MECCKFWYITLLVSIVHRLHSVTSEWLLFKIKCSREQSLEEFRNYDIQVFYVLWFKSEIYNSKLGTVWTPQIATYPQCAEGSCEDRYASVFMNLSRHCLPGENSDYKSFWVAIITSTYCLLVLTRRLVNWTWCLSLLLVTAFLFKLSPKWLKEWKGNAVMEWHIPICFEAWLLQHIISAFPDPQLTLPQVARLAAR